MRNHLEGIGFHFLQRVSIQVKRTQVWNVCKVKKKICENKKTMQDDIKKRHFHLKQKLDYLFIITASKLPKFEFWRPFSLVVATVSKQKKLQRPVKKGAKIQT